MTADKIVVTIDSDLEDLIPGFLQNRRNDTEALRTAMAGGKADTLQSIGHSLKGVGGGYGFHGLSEIGAEIERKAKGGDLAGVGESINRMIEYLDRVEIVYE